ESLVTGTIVKGKITDKRNNFYIVDVGLKSEGIIPIDEFGEEEPETNEDGTYDEDEFLIEAVENRNGEMVLSKKKVARIRGWEELVATKEEGDVVIGRVVRKIKGGLLVDVGIPVFLPASQIDIRRAPDIAEYVGTDMECKILKIDHERKNIVVSRRKLIEEARNSQKEVLLQNLSDGQTIEGVVKNITDFGAFIDLGGIDGLLHITDMTWSRISHPSEMLSMNDRVRVRVLSFDKKNERISLSMKELRDSPWQDIENKYPINSKLKGKVVNIMPYGAFVELEEGIEGLVHVSEMSWTKKIHHPSEVVAIGDEVEVIVLAVNKDKEEISLGMKQVEPDPWGEMGNLYPEGSIVHGKVRNMTAYGAFVELEEGIDGLLHVSDLSWTRRVQHPSQMLKKDDIVKTKVLKVDSDKKRISLGLKQLDDDPWFTSIPAKYQQGMTLSGKVSKVTSFGAFVDLGEEGLEGLLHVSEILKPDGQENSIAPEKFLKIGQEITVMVLHVDMEKRRIGLSQSAVSKGLPTEDYLENLSKLEDEAEIKMTTPVEEED
ncbi:MAG: 30S ribosomal protein S1, partial [Planctomycetes bacterium]|nr:30S ribosomal protein S1 [Planctomycetota bacterium]